MTGNKTAGIIEDMSASCLRSNGEFQEQDANRKVEGSESRSNQVYTAAGAFSIKIKLPSQSLSAPEPGPVFECVSA